MLAQRAWDFVSPLNAGAWAALAAVPLGILLLYFLKLRRRAVQVPSTLLWKRSLEDLHVNSLFQRLRRNLLLFLQLLMVGLVMLALAGPRIRGIERQGQRLVLAIDESASMGATDVEPTRLEGAQREARKLIASMAGGDLAMIVAFSDTARVVANYTGDKDLLLRRLNAITATERPTSLREALQLVAGLANPQKYLEVGEGVVATSVVPPKLFLFTDGGFADVEGFSLGTIEPQVVVIGPPLGAPPAPQQSATAVAPAGAAVALTAGLASDSVAILALSAARNDEDPQQVQLFGRVHNYRLEPVSTRAGLFRLDPARPGAEGLLIDAVELEIEPRTDQAFQFDLKTEALSEELEVRLDVTDALMIDNRAQLVLANPRKARVLLVTSGNRFLADALETEAVSQVVELARATPEEYEGVSVLRDVELGRYDLVIFDGASPKAAPEANALYFGVLPPGLDAAAARTVSNPVVLDWDLAHPLLQYVRDLNTVVIQESLVLEPPVGARVLIEGDSGPIAMAVPRGGYVDVVIGFGLMRDREFNTNWTLKRGFPLFVFNVLKVLGHAREAEAEGSTAPGRPVTLRPETLAEAIDVVGPDGVSKETVARTPQGTFVANRTDRTGVYRARWGEGPQEREAFAVNLFDPRESDLAPRGQVPPGLSYEQADAYRIKIGFTPVTTTSFETPAQQDWWWPLTLVALGVLVIEWIVYNRRMHV
jgi:hypothetical protein